MSPFGHELKSSDRQDDRVAATGSGKTLTIVAKAAYAIHRGLVGPDRIVMLAFNDVAANELSKRAKRALSSVGLSADVSVMTFHTLGNRIIGHATGAKRRVPSWVSNKENASRKVAGIVDQLRDRSAQFRVTGVCFGWSLATTARRKLLSSRKPNGIRRRSEMRFARYGASWSRARRSA